MRRASWSAVSAFSSVKSGPPNTPACWPVTTATEAGSARRASGGARRGRRVPLFLLSPQQRDQPSAIAGLLLRPRDRVAPRVGLHRVARVEPLDLLEVVGVVTRQRPDPRETADVDARRFQAAGRVGGDRGRGGLGRHELVLSQSRSKAVKDAHDATPLVTRVKAPRIP